MSYIILDFWNDESDKQGDVYFDKKDVSERVSDPSKATWFATKLQAKLSRDRIISRRNRRPYTIRRISRQEVQEDGPFLLSIADLLRKFDKSTGLSEKLYARLVRERLQKAKP